MSYIYFDINGRLREYVTTPKRKGSENVDTLCVYWEGNDGTIVLPSQCFIEYGHESIHAGPLTANKISRTIIPFNRERDLRFFHYGKTYQFMCFDLPTAVSSTSGFWHSSVSIHERLTDNVVQVLGDITFEVEESSIVPSGNLNLSQYNYILDSIKDIEGNLDSKLDRTTPTSIIDGNGDKVVDFASDKVTIHKKAQTIEIPVEAKDIANKEYVDSKVSTETEGMVKVGDLKTLNGESLLGSGDIAYDASLSATSTNAVQNKVINSTISELSYQLAMVRENIFQTVLSEIDYTEKFATLYAIPDTLSDADGTHRVLFSETQLREVAGNSIAFNQLQRIQVNSQTRTSNGITLTDNRDGTYTINGTATADANFGIGTISMQAHKYLIKGCPSGGSIQTYYVTDSYTFGFSDVGNGTIYNKSSAGPFTYYIRIKNGTTVNNLVFRPQVFDLTLMGLDSVSTVEEARSELLKRGIDIDQYNPFSDGEIRNTTASGVKVRNYNLLNINRTQGTLNGADYTMGNKQDFEEGNYYNSLSINDYVLQNTVKNIKVEGTQITFTATSFAYGLGFPVRVIPGKSYSLDMTPVLNPHPSYKIVMWYDDSGSYIGSDAIVNSESITAPINGYWGVILLRSSGDNVTCSYKDICFHLSTIRTGYAPYKEPKAISFASTELLGAGEAHDTIEVVEGDKVAGIQRYNLVQVKRVGTVDLGTLSWAYSSTKFTAIINTLGGKREWQKVPNLICSRYKTVGMVNVVDDINDKSVTYIKNEDKHIQIKDTSYTDATAFKTAMDGVILNYELATPTRTTIAENLTFEEVSATIEQGGSIETVYETLAPNCTTGFVVKKAKEVSK